MSQNPYHLSRASATDTDCRLDLTESFKLIIGADKREVVVHKHMLIRTSDFFKACCSGHNWKENSTKIIELPEDDYETLSVYLDWLYTGEVVATDEDATDEGRGNPKWQSASGLHAVLVKLAILADRLLDLKFGNIIADEYTLSIRTCGWGPEPKQVALVYEKLPPSSPMRRLMVDWYRSHDERAAYMEKHRNEFIESFFFDMMVSFARETKEDTKSRLEMKNKCQYHTHHEKFPTCS